MIELRSEFSGFYKGLIYCSSIEEANEICDFLDGIVKENISTDLPAKVKRGCSEYPLKFPQYKEINNFGSQLMNYNEEWRDIEKNYDKKYPMNTKKEIRPSLTGLSLSDFLIMQNWLSYADGIGDKSIELIAEKTVFSKDIYGKAKARSQIYEFTN